jgi:hypothetical protein
LAASWTLQKKKKEKKLQKLRPTVQEFEPHERQKSFVLHSDTLEHKRADFFTSLSSK